ncbi:MAG TPA: alkaline phosphatase family protein [Candidatus Saccharimonadales bacterium]|nr:alkaline phosphatase family protein [Candidatus Saccharimonadales bacterium]
MRIGRRLAVLAIAVLLATLSAPAVSLAAPPSPATTLGIRYVVVVVMENRSYDQIVGSASAPYLNSLTRQYGLATNYTGVAHPSEPNYLALLGGSTFGIADDGVHDISGTNLLDQLAARGLTWRVAAEDVPGHCYPGATAYGGSDGPGWYARKHEPAISFTDVRTTPTRCANIENLAAFRPGAANVQLVIPNFCHDMHDCSTATGDAFLRSWLPRILRSATFRQTLLVITWDEGTDDVGGGGHVATLVISPSVHPGAHAASRMNHYSIPRTVEDLFGLACLRNSCRARDLLAFLHPA